MSIITECDNCGYRSKYGSGSVKVPYGHDGAIQWSSDKSCMLVKEYICDDCTKSAKAAANEAHQQVLMARRSAANEKPRGA